MKVVGALLRMNCVMTRPSPWFQNDTEAVFAIRLKRAYRLEDVHLVVVANDVSAVWGPDV